jgi:hypothetical protein
MERLPMARPLVSLSEKRADTPEEVRAQTLRTLLGASLGGLGLGMAGGGIWHLLREYLMRQGSPARRTPTLQLSTVGTLRPQDEDLDEEDVVERIEDDEDEFVHQKAAANPLQPYPATSLKDVQWLPAAYIAALGLSGMAGWELVDWLRKRALKVKQQQELSSARDDYEAALRDQFGVKEGASNQFGALDKLYDATQPHLLEKVAVREPSTGYRAHNTDLLYDFLSTAKNLFFAPQLTRDYWKWGVVTPALLAALGFGYMGYKGQRDFSKEKALTEALRRREVEMRARKPVPLRAVDVAEEE